MKKMITYSTLLFLFIIFINVPFSGYSQTKNDKYKIELKLMTPQINLNSDYTNLVIVVSVHNLGGKPEAFGTSLHYGYKKYHTQDYYLEAVDKDNNYVDIDGPEDLELYYE